MSSEPHGPLIDIGANLTHKAFRGDLPEVLARAHSAGVVQIIVTGTTIDSSECAQQLCRQHPGLFATAGIHPHHASEYDDQREARLASLLADSTVVAAGETGLDYNRLYAPMEDQRRAFEAQLWLAANEGLPVFVHQRDAHSDLLAILRGVRDRLAGVVVHCFTDERNALIDYLDLGCHIGITGWICDQKRGQHLRELAALIPASRLMIETDAPFLLPPARRAEVQQRRNEPAFLIDVLQTLAACRGQALDDTAAATTATARQFFALAEP